MDVGSALNNPWVWGVGAAVGLVVLLRRGSGSSNSGPDYSPLIATNALAASTSVQLSSIQAQVIDSNNKRIVANYGVDGAVIGKIIDNNGALALAHDRNVTSVKTAKLANEYGFKALDTTLEQTRIAADVAKTQADYKYRVDDIIARNSPSIARDLATISSNTTIETARARAASNENIARINANASLKQSQQRSDSDTLSSVLGFASSVIPFL